MNGLNNRSSTSQWSQINWYEGGEAVALLAYNNNDNGVVELLFELYDFFLIETNWMCGTDLTHIRTAAETMLI